MIREILGILADIVGIVFIWWQPDKMAWYWKLLISGVLIAIALTFFFLTKKRPIERVKDYSWEDNKPVMLFLNKNSYYSSGMLVSIYMKEEGKTTLCAVGHVNMDPEGKKEHIQVLHQIDTSTMAKIRSSRKKCSKFFVKPSVTQKEIMDINWK